ncbi:MAG: VOC family protein [Synergistaceae bacterium]|nr:VOC family protein [Synergistaceae bacterium]
MKIHHIGYLVDNIENAAREFERLGFSRRGETVEDTSREVYILFLYNAEQAVELIQPVGETSPVYGLRKKYRNSPYHICYETDDLQREIETMTNINRGYVLIQPPKPAPAIPGCPNVAFLMNSHIGIIELVEMR